MVGDSARPTSSSKPAALMVDVKMVEDLNVFIAVIHLPPTAIETFLDMGSWREDVLRS